MTCDGGIDGTLYARRAMGDGLGFWVTSSPLVLYLCVKLYSTIEFQLQQHNRERGDLKGTNTRWGVLGILLQTWEAN